MMERQLKDMPENQRNQMIELVTKNPELFMKIGQEIQEKMKEGKDQMMATMDVLKAHQEEIKKLV